MNISLIGYKGSGKTTIGRLLANKLKIKMISVDDEIKKKAKLTVSRFVRKHGWEKFRDMEAEILEDVCNFEDCIIDAGGGAILRNENIVNLRRNGLVILLTADINTLTSRIKNNNISPSEARSLKRDVARVLEERSEKYSNAADYTIDTSDMTPEEICDLIMHYINVEYNHN